MRVLRLLAFVFLFAIPLCAQQPVVQGQTARTAGTITTSSTSIPISTAGFSVATITVNGTYAGITVNFEFSDDGGSTYYPDTCSRTDTNVQESSEALPSNQSRAWDCGVFAATNFRVRSSAFTSGTANIGITLSAAPIEPAPTVSMSGIGQVSATASANGSANPIFTRETDGTNPVILDPCRTQANIFKPISQTASAQLVTGTSAKKIYICSINLVTAAANNVAMVEGTGTVCATGIAGMAGGTTAATGWNFAANGGLTQGNGMGSIMAEATNADNLCLLQSAAVQLSGVIGYVVQ
jgi:hypothetical protein